MIPHSFKKRRTSLLFSGISLLVIILLPALCLAQAEKIFSQHNKAVVVVMTYDGANKGINQGSGFIVRQDGVIVTNYHVISDAKNIKIKVANKVFNVDYIIDLDKENDIAILKVNASNMPIVILGDFRKTKIGEKIYVISSPKGLENTISDGILSGKREDEDDKTILQITAPISPGSSGGPVFNQNGQVIGVATFLLKESQNLNFAMPVDGIKDKITAKKVAAIKPKQIESYNKSSEYWYNLGTIYVKSGKLQEAVDAFKEAIRIKPDYAEAHNGLGSAYGKSGKHQEAMDAFKRAIQIKPDYAKAHTNLGTAYSQSGRLQEAIEAHKQAIRIQPDYAEAYNGLGLAYGKSGRNQEAIEALKEAIRIKPDYANPHNNLGVIYGKSGRNQEAIEAFKEAIRIKPDDAAAHAGLGASYCQSGRNQEAIEALKQAIRIKPDLAVAHFVLGSAYSQSDRLQEAIESFKEGLRIKPDDAVAHYNLGLTYVRLKDRNGALSEYGILKNLDPERAKKLFDLIYK